MRSLEEVAEPFESLSIALLLRHTAHKDVDGSSTLVPLIFRLNPQSLPQFILRNSASLVYLIAEDDDRHFL